MKKHVGIVAEDKSDVQVVIELIKKVVPDKKFTPHSFVGHGCGKIQGKSFQWASSLKTQGCTLLIVLQDLDENNLSSLHNQLSHALIGCAIPNHLVVIPIREIEAWLLSDNQAIQTALSLTENVKPIPNPQSIMDPKKTLSDIIYFRSGKTKRYVNSAHNQKIAACVDLINIRRCESFLPLEVFVLKHIT